MPHDTAPSDDSDLVVAHLSDLHVGASGFDACWSSLCDELAAQHVQLILATGDLADSNRTALLTDARSHLASLSTSLSIPGQDPIPYLVCPGNHDTLRKGVKWWRKDSAEFYRVFANVLPRPIRDIDLPKADPTWKLRIVSIDSVVGCDTLARGFITAAELKLVEDASRDADGRDFLILLVHHHPLSVRSLEKRIETVDDLPTRMLRSATSLLASTQLINGGTLLEAASIAHVDLVLHGHEHAGNLAKYSSMEAGAGEVAIVGAGSSTGTDTVHGCAKARMSYNLFRFSPSQRITVEVRRFSESMGWFSEKKTKLANALTLRKARFLRRSKTQIDAPPGSEFVKCVELTEEGDGIVQDVRNDWPIPKDRKLIVEAANSTGKPTKLRVVIHVRSGEAWRPDKEPKFVKADKDHTWRYECDLPKLLGDRAERLDVRYCWKGGAILRETVMRRARGRAAPGIFRRKGLEYVGQRVRAPIAGLTLIVRIPEHFAPLEGGMSVYAAREDDAGIDSERRRSIELTRRIHRFERGLFSVLIPYPWPGYMYAMAWKPYSPSGPKSERRAKSTATMTRGSEPRSVVGGLRRGLTPANPSRKGRA